MEEYKPNSYKSREEQADVPAKKAEKVVSGTVKSKKKSEMQKIADVFIAEDIHNVKNYIWMDVLVPSIKKAMSEIVKNGIDMILYGEAGRPRNTSASSTISYGSCFKRDNAKRDFTRTRGGYEYGNYLIDNRGEAEDVLSRMDEMMATYKIVSVADFYDLLGVDGNYTDYKYGWTDIRSAKIVPTSDGYLIKLPKAMPLD